VNQNTLAVSILPCGRNFHQIEFHCFTDHRQTQSGIP
jgi:hypothetical protein